MPVHAANYYTLHMYDPFGDITGFLIRSIPISYPGKYERNFFPSSQHTHTLLQTHHSKYLALACVKTHPIGILMLLFQSISPGEVSKNI
jgi:hypothetical protein